MQSPQGKLPPRSQAVSWQILRGERGVPSCQCPVLLLQALGLELQEGITKATGPGDDRMKPGRPGLGAALSTYLG